MGQVGPSRTSFMDSAAQTFMAMGAIRAAVAVWDIRLERSEVMKDNAIRTPIGWPIATWCPAATTILAQAFAKPLALIAWPHRLSRTLQIHKGLWPDEPKSTQRQPVNSSWRANYAWYRAWPTPRPPAMVKKMGRFNRCKTWADAHVRSRSLFLSSAKNFKII